MAEAVYLWQYLTRSNLGGFFIALSGGLDSASVSLFVYGMAKVVLQSVKSGDERTLSELRRITGEKDLVPETPQDIVSRLLHTCYMGTVNSGEHTRSRAKRLAARIGAFHSDVNIDETVSAHEAIIKQAMNFEPRFQVEGGSVAVSYDQGGSACVYVETNRAGKLGQTEYSSSQPDDCCLRGMRPYEVLDVSDRFQLAQLSTTARKLPRAGTSLLVVSRVMSSYPTRLTPISSPLVMSTKLYEGTYTHHHLRPPQRISANVGRYLTKYDCSSGDIAPLVS